MTNILLSIIAVLLFARIVLQIRQCKRAVEKGYASTSEVENIRVGSVEYWKIPDRLEFYGKQGYELVAVACGNNDRITLYFTRKKIKNYYNDDKNETA